MSFRVNGVEFSDLGETLRIDKAQGLSRADVLSYFSLEENRRAVLECYDGLEALSVREAVAFENTEQRMAALASFSPDTILRDLDARSLDRQTIRKRQMRWRGDLEPYEVEFEDTYELLTYRVSGSSPWDELDVFVVKCSCPSTDREYFLYVPGQVAKDEDAIAAVAWTMQLDGKPMTKQQYLELMFSET